MTAHYNDIIVGAGSAGSVLAARLSEDPARRVLLLEGGPDHARPDELPEEVFHGRSMSFTGQDWGFRADVHDGRRIRYPRGKLTGGSSAVGATVGLRGVPADYDDWAAAGNPAWSYEGVLPYFRRLESDGDYGESEFHGGSGPIPIRRWSADELPIGQTAFTQSCLEHGFAEVADHNHPEATGVGSIPSTRHDRDRRATTASTYLALTRGRANLELAPGLLVDRVVFDGQRAVGVLVGAPGAEPELVRGDRVLLAAGAIGTPAILLRSGVGPAEDLRRLGVDVRADLPGVGANLVDHQRTGAFLVPEPGSVDRTEAFLQQILRTTSPVTGDFNDLQYYMVNHFGLGPFPELQMLAGTTEILGVMVVAQRPGSRGRVAVDSTDPRAAPVIRLNFLDDERELDVLVDGVRTAWRLAHHPDVLKLGQGFVVLRDAMIDNDDMVRQYVKTSLESAYHPTGTVRMGPASDPSTAVDERGAVHGLEALHVCDASIMPNTVRANTNLTSIMIGERMADWLRAG
ncbi:GMC family oxidoreductase [Actinosynnema mirum]|uniref:Glucose-methanol-choline oxidoreductase n=1 Tax=Actinosynnema mirum (strain ATCC 29888 / DSM 43827 / JCM 3225 / NBRC 14064 / NCIMB 13271 / NRRL B-12336 / IMRU 3971 / 101) TaxID=446462 RepID=C6WG20_ACTMD|nr:GMC family oxidoreductase N-terminal domain-containing protein [Actinosynnema mirum]ACU37956.1 glucose-methanol-choline oxidoreductase [Actinosynnema mirum DSM 43827]